MVEELVCGMVDVMVDVMVEELVFSMVGHLVEAKVASQVFLMAVMMAISLVAKMGSYLEYVWVQQWDILKESKMEATKGFQKVEEWVSSKASSLVYQMGYLLVGQKVGLTDNMWEQRMVSKLDWSDEKMEIQLGCKQVQMQWEIGSEMV